MGLSQSCKEHTCKHDTQKKAAYHPRAFMAMGAVEPRRVRLDCHAMWRVVAKASKHWDWPLQQLASTGTGLSTSRVPSQIVIIVLALSTLSQPNLAGRKPSVACIVDTLTLDSFILSDNRPDLGKSRKRFF